MNPDRGYAICPMSKTFTGRPLRPQGAGRLGGTIASRLVNLGLAQRIHQGQPIVILDRAVTASSSGYQITRQGRMALREG